MVVVADNEKSLVWLRWYRRLLWISVVSVVLLLSLIGASVVMLLNPQLLVFRSVVLSVMFLAASLLLVYVLSTRFWRALDWIALAFAARDRPDLFGYYWGDFVIWREELSRKG